MGGHVDAHIGPVIDVCGFPERGIRAPGVMVVSAQHDGGGDLTGSDHFIKFQVYGYPALGILV